MPRALLILALPLAAFAFVACGGDDDNDDGGNGDGGPAATATAEPEENASPTPAAGPTEAGGDQGVTLELSASDIAFSTSELSAPAGVPVTIDFANADAGIPHNVHFFEGSDASGTSIGMTQIMSGSSNSTLDLGSLDAGEYYYQCDVHTSMNGTLTVS